MQTLHHYIAKDGFRLRGTEMSRVDGFSDVVFGFALTLIVVSLEVPKTYNELHELLLGFIPFAISFAFLIMVWWSHFRFFRRYGTHDAGTVAINAVLLFTVLFYVYPLKFLFSLVGNQFTHSDKVAAFSDMHQHRELMTIYGIGFAAIYFCLVALQWNAYRQREHLRLSPLERTLTLTYMWDDFGTACIGLLCCLVAALLPPEQAGASGFCFFLIGVWKTIHGYASAPRIRRAHARTSAEDLSHSPFDQG